MVKVTTEKDIWHVTQNTPYCGDAKNWLTRRFTFVVIKQKVTAQIHFLSPGIHAARAVRASGGFKNGWGVKTQKVLTIWSWEGWGPADKVQPSVKNFDPREVHQTEKTRTGRPMWVSQKCPVCTGFPVFHTRAVVFVKFPCSILLPVGACIISSLLHGAITVR